MIATFTKNLRFARALKARPFAMVWIGQSLSGLGDGIFYIALAWQVLLMTHSGTAMGLVLVASAIPRLVFMLIGGVTADRLPRQMILLWSDGGRGVVVLLISMLGFTGHLQFWHLVIEALIFGLVDGFFMPAVLAITPDLVEKDDLPSANALVSGSQTLTQLIGPVLGAALIALISPMGVFALNGLSFLISVAFLLSVQIPESHVGQFEVPRRGIAGVMVDVREGVFYVRSSRWLWVSILCLSIGSIGMAGPITVAMPKLIHDVYGQGAWLLGLISSAGAVGSLLGLGLVGQMKQLKRRGLISYLSLIPAGVGIVLFGLPWSHTAFFIVGAVASALFGLSGAFFNTNWFTILQEMVPGDKLGRVISLTMLGSFAAIPVSQALGGMLTDRLGPAMVFLLGGLLALSINFLPLLVRDVREMQ
ncbi:MAG TPA: MFS transporter [Ktedonosporobacter sp.]|nr:MFS transporter [Ktedonosporobacter sp.]